MITNDMFMGGPGVMGSPVGSPAGGANTPLARWREAERRLYPLIMSAPELYEYSLRLVRAIADDLHNVENSEELERRFADSTSIAARVAADVGVDASQVDVDAVAGAAFALRQSELDAAARRATALSQLAAARDRGEPWATIYESGRVTPDGGVVPPYHLVEASVQRPVGLHSWATFDMEAGAVVYGVEVVGVDADSGRWWLDDSPSAVEQTHTDAESWRASLAQLRETVLRSP